LNLIRRIELILFSFLLLLTLVSVTAYRLVVHESFVGMEAVQEKRDIERMRAVIAQEADNLQALVEDWSYWDDVYTFMTDNNSAFIKSNLFDATFETYRIDLVMFLNNANEVHYLREKDHRTGQQLQFSKFGNADWRSENLLVPMGPSTPLWGMVQTEEGPMLVTAQYIYRSDESGPSSGLLVFGRLLGEFAQSQISDEVQMAFKIYSQSAEPSAINFSGNTADALIERTDETSRIFLPAKSIDKEAGFIIEFERQRVISRQGQVAFNSFLFILVVAVFVTMLIIRRYMERQVVDALDELGAQMKEVSGKQYLPERIKMARNDEIGTLATEFNLMLDRLKQDQVARDEAVREMTASLADSRRAEGLAKLGSYEWDWELDKLVACSEELANIWRMPVNELMQVLDSDAADIEFIHPEDRERYIAIETEATDKGEGFTREYRLMLPDGDIRYIREFTEPELDDQGKVLRTKGSVQDVTDQVLLHEQLRQAQKLEAIGQLTGGIAHDFNNMLVVILGNLELTIKQVGDGHPSLELLAASQRAANRASLLTERLLTFARKRPLQIQDVELQALLIGMKEEFEITLGETIRLEMLQVDRELHCRTDTAQLENALLNLVINAHDAMPRGGILNIELESTYLDTNYASTQEELQPGRFVCITFRDTGTGMSQEIMDQVFDPFFTTKPFGEGTGLGLSMVYGFLKQCQGHVSVSSQPGEGTSVKVFLPESHGMILSQDENIDEVVPMGEGELVLVVEDEADVRDLVVMFLAELGYKTKVAENAGEALTLLKSDAAFDLLFSDVVLPGGVNGVDLAQWAVGKMPELKVLLTSGYPNDVGTQRGALEFPLIKKPYTQEQLGRAVQEIL
jgi:signal transduction histidine kinase/sensor domain CHASE-containing protein